MIFSFFKSKSVLGVDLGTATIKFVELAKDKGRFNLKNYGLLNLGEVTKSGSSKTMSLPSDDATVIGALKELLAKSKVKTKDAVTAIPSFLTFATVLRLPYLSEKDLAKAIPFEARKYVPIPINNVILDWSIINIGEIQKTDSKGAYPDVEVFLAAVPKDEAARYRDILLNAGLDVKALELENIALARSLVGNDQSPVIIVNIGGRSTSILIVDKGFERISHNFEIGGFEITKTLAKSLNVGLEKAEKMQREIGLLGKEGALISNSIVSLLDMMVFETKKTVNSYEEKTKIKVAKVILSGGLANMPGLVEFFKEKISLETSIGNSFARVIYPKELENVIKSLSPILAVACGLAMREI